MPKLTDTQLVILTAAAQREDGGALPPPKSLDLKGAALTKTLAGLLKRGLLDERPAAPAAPAWRKDKDGRRMMLIITEAGLAALEDNPAIRTRRPATPKKSPSKNASSKRRKHRVERTGKATRSATRTGAKSKSKTTRTLARTGTKQALLIDLLKRKTGATIDEIVAATGWQAHSVRGAISGTIKKKFGLAVASAKVEGRGRVYRIAGRD